VEAKYGLTVTGATGRTGVPAVSRAEQRKHRVPSVTIGQVYGDAVLAARAFRPHLA
jgi:hypothetical protein